METIPGRSERIPPGEDRFTAEQLEREPRDRILAALVETVAKRGYQGTTIENIVKRAGVSRATFYEHFDNRESCLLEGFDEALADLHSRAREAIGEHEDWPQRVIAYLATVLDYVAARPAMVRTYLVEVVTAGPVALKRYEEALQGFGQEISRGRVEVGTEGDLPEILEESIIGGIVWMIHQRIVRAEAETAPALLPTMVEFTLAPYLGDAVAAELAAGVAAQSTTRLSFLSGDERARE